MDIVQEIIKKYESKKGVVLARMFGSQALKVNDKVFMIIMKDGIVFKLHPDDVEAALSIKGADYFDAHKNGHKMKEWIHYPLKSVTKDCIAIAEKSFQYISASSKKTKKTK